MMTRNGIVVVVALLAVTFTGCAGSGWNANERQDVAEGQASGQTHDAALAASRFKAEDPSIQRFFDSAHGYAIFPSVGKGGIGIGAAHGKGEVYEHGTLVGYSTLTQVSIGLQLGGQEYSEVIFFRDGETFADFKRGNFELSAQASAVAVTAGAASNASYDRGVAIFTLPLGGLMYEASVGGQKFTYEPRY